MFIEQNNALLFFNELFNIEAKPSCFIRSANIVIGSLYFLDHFTEKQLNKFSLHYSNKICCRIIYFQLILVYNIIYKLTMFFLSHKLKSTI